mmetsp:Transcript_20182/g.48412  ORF Transcript_20182/g.48412 Transcript_20182/m.48412 type:complete len:206 (-) Transcript_20182:404-1021(-)
MEQDSTIGSGWSFPSLTFIGSYVEKTGCLALWCSSAVVCCSSTSAFSPFPSPRMPSSSSCLRSISFSACCRCSSLNCACCWSSSACRCCCNASCCCCCTARSRARACCCCWILSCMDLNCVSCVTSGMARILRLSTSISRGERLRTDCSSLTVALTSLLESCALLSSDISSSVLCRFAVSSGAVSSIIPTSSSKSSSKSSGSLFA